MGTLGSSAFDEKYWPCFWLVVLLLSTLLCSLPQPSHKGQLEKGALCIKDTANGAQVAKKSYRIAGKFGGDFNLAVWRIVRTSPNLNSCQI